MKVLNLYAGIGGNRKLWQDVEVTAVEYDPKIAAIYKDFFPDDTVIVTDAHQYLLDHYKEFDFVWSSPPCPTHSKLCMINDALGRQVSYPDMALYQEILLLKHFFEGKYVVENVMGYYEPLIKPQESGRHYFWANFTIPKIKTTASNIMGGASEKKILRVNKSGLNEADFVGWSREKIDKSIKNMVDYEVGLSILNSARNIIRENNSTQKSLFAA